MIQANFSKVGFEVSRILAENFKIYNSDQGRANKNLDKKIIKKNQFIFLPKSNFELPR